MIISEQWLKSHVQTNLSAEEIASTLTMAGLEVDGIEPAAPDFSHVVVGEVVSLNPHPDADKLRVATINVGQEENLQIVCGAKNISEQQRVPVATVGAVLPGNFKIKKSKLRGVESFGMVCSASELGCADNSDGIWVLPPDAPIGEDIRQFLSLDDNCIDIDLTPNRSDCFSVRGIARELSLLTGSSMTKESHESVKPEIDDTLTVSIDSPDACPAYTGRVIKGVNAGATSPLWLQEKLRRCGLRSINLVVDVTNFVMWELGQPMHAFDMASLNGGITVREATKDEMIVLLDGKELKLDVGTLVIADDQSALAFAGVMGGEASGVTEASTDIFLESAFFPPQLIAGKAREYGLHTDSSHRFERGVDPQLQSIAIEYATKLILEIAGGKPGPVISVRTAAMEEWETKASTKVTLDKINAVIGHEFDVDQVETILKGLQVEFTRDGQEWTCVAPTFRFDLNQEVDYIEEVARVFGFHNIPTNLIKIPQKLATATESELHHNQVIDRFVSLGFQEAISYSFVDSSYDALLGDKEKQVALANPMSSEMSVMRTSLWSSLLPLLHQNVNRQHADVRFVEYGKKFLKVDDEVQEVKTISGVLCGRAYLEQWNNAERKIDFYDVKGVLEHVVSLTGRHESEIEFELSSGSVLHPGQSAEIKIDGQHIGQFGMLHPKVVKQIGLKVTPFVFELNWAQLKASVVPAFKPISKFPLIRRDLSLLVDKAVTAGQLLHAIRSEDAMLVQDVAVFDIYQGDGVANDQKGVAIRIMLQHIERTLNDAEVDSIISQIIERLKCDFGATLRG